MFGGHPRRGRNLFRLIVGINQIAGLLVSGRKYRLVAYASPSLEVRGIGNTVILYLQHARVYRLAILAKLDVISHDGREGVAVQVGCELSVVEGLCAFHRLAEQLEVGIAEIITER